MLAEPAINAVPGEALTKFCEVLATIIPTGSGNVTGPGSAVAGHIAVFDGITGRLIADGGGTIADVLGTAAAAAAALVVAVQYPPITTVSAATLTIDASHIGYVIECTNAAGCNITLPENILAQRQWFKAYGTLGQVTFTQGTNVQIDKPTSLSRKTREAFCSATVYCRGVGATDVFILEGDLEVT